MSLLVRTKHYTYCPYKGDCTYYNIPVGGTKSDYAVWTYEKPYEAVANIKEYLAFYPSRVDAIDCFSNQVTEEPHPTMLLLDLCLGLRCSELLALKWEDVDWKEQCVHVRRTIVQGRVDEVKTKYSRFPSIPISPVSCWPGNAGASSEATPTGSSPVPTAEASNRTPPGGVQQRWIKPAATQAGLGGGIGWHTLRHTYRTLLDETGAPLKVQQELMRHTDIRTTMNIYGAAASSSKRDANSKVVGMVLRKAAGM